MAKESTLDVRRHSPPEIGLCKHPQCGAMIEWVTTRANRPMPVTHPLVTVREHTMLDESVITVIRAEQSHFVTCPGAQEFRSKRHA